MYYSNSRNGINLDKLAHQQKTALKAIASSKQYTAGLHVSVGSSYLLVGSWSGRWLAEKEEACWRVSERIGKRCTHSTCKRGLCNQNTKQTVSRVDRSGTNENNGIAVQASMRSSINNDKATSPFQIPWHHDAWQCCSTSCNCDSATSSSFVGHS